MMLVILLSAVFGFSAFGYQDRARDIPGKSKAEAAALKGKRKLTEAEAQAVVQAVQDEIYDYGYEPQFYQMGDNVGKSSHWISRLPIYINPETEDYQGQTIYKLMPYGEVFRAFEVEDDGSVVLYGNPQLGFPPTQPSHQTVYMDDDEVCQMKHKWLRRSFEVDDSPTPERRQEAVRRQKLRTGFSDWEYRHPNPDKEPNK